MANDRIWIRCTTCKKKVLVEKYYPSMQMGERLSWAALAAKDGAPWARDEKALALLAREGLEYPPAGEGEDWWIPEGKKAWTYAAIFRETCRLLYGDKPPNLFASSEDLERFSDRLAASLSDITDHKATVLRFAIEKQQGDGDPTGWADKFYYDCVEGRGRGTAGKVRDAVSRARTIRKRIAGVPLDVKPWRTPWRVVKAYAETPIPYSGTYESLGETRFPEWEMASIQKPEPEPKPEPKPSELESWSEYADASPPFILRGEKLDFRFPVYAKVRKARKALARLLAAKKRGKIRAHLEKVRAQTHALVSEAMSKYEKNVGASELGLPVWTQVHRARRLILHEMRRLAGIGGETAGT